MVDRVERIKANAENVRQRISAAARRSGRSAEDVTLIAVSKYGDDELARDYYHAGLVALGESRPQQLWEKHQALIDLDVRWHLIGHLQTNKVRRTLPCAELIHGGDSRRLLECLNDEARAANTKAAVLLQVNVSREPAKHGFTRSELFQSVETICRLDSLRIRGLMAMAQRTSDPSVAREQFAALRETRDDVRSRCDLELSELSMGMSGDFEPAIEEGATMVRIGSALIDGVSL